MNPAEYYSQTLMKAAMNLGPWVLFAVVGYILFIKLPFWLALKVNRNEKRNDIPISGSKEAPKYRPQDFNTPKVDPLKEEQRRQQKEEERQRQERKKVEREKAKAEEEKKKQYKQWQKEEKKAREEDSSHTTTAEEIFQLKPGEQLNKSQLKKRYHELLRQYHPDKVAALGAEFKDIAEKRTKQINSAYEELKKKAS
jgi:hypothetical protein